MNRKAISKARIGVFGIGLEAYWDQFEGLKEKLEGFQQHVETQLENAGGQVISAGLVDSHPSAQTASDLFARSDLDLLICYVGTYATSSTVLPVVQRTRAPVLVLNLQPVAALDYENTDTALWLESCCACCVPEISNAFARARIQFNVVSGMLFDDARAWIQISDWVRAATVKRTLSKSRIGFLGHTYPGMMDMYSDFTMVTAQTGAHVEILEMEDLQACFEAVSDTELEAKKTEIRQTFDIAQPGRDKISVPVTDESFEWSSRVACALDRMASHTASAPIKVSGPPILRSCSAGSKRCKYSTPRRCPASSLSSVMRESAQRSLRICQKKKTLLSSAGSSMSE